MTDLDRKIQWKRRSLKTDKIKKRKKKEKKVLKVVLRRRKKRRIRP